MSRLSPYSTCAQVPRRGGWSNGASSVRAVILLFAACVVAAQPRSATIASLRCTDCVGNGISTAGQVVGQWDANPFLYAAGASTKFSSLAGFANGINAAGQITGWHNPTGGQFGFAFLYAGGNMINLGALAGGSYSTGYGINPAGQVVGSSDTSSHYVDAFLYSGGVMSDLGSLAGFGSVASAINTTGQIVGWSPITNSATTAHGFFYSKGVMADLGTLPGGSYSAAYGVNDTGQVVGVSTTVAQVSSSRTLAVRPLVVAAQPSHAVLWDVQTGAKTDLGTLGGDFSIALGVNNLGQVVGWSYTSGNAAQHAFLYSDGVMTDLNALLPSGWNLQTATAINDAGQIVVNGLVAAGGGSYQQAFLMTLSQQLVGIDVSAVPSSGEWANLMANYNPSFVIANAWGGGSEKPARQILDSAPAGIKKAAYLLLNYDDPTQSGPTQVGYAIEALGSAYQPGNANGNLSFMAVDIEPICYARDANGNCTNRESLPQDIASIAARFQKIYEAVQTVERAGLNPVIYANQSAWTEIAGGSTPANPALPLGCLPLWNPRYDLVADLGTAWTAFGAWTQRVGKQYAENDTDFGSVDVDLNVFSPGVFSGGNWGMALDETNANLGANVVVSRSGFRLNHATNQYVQTVTITNTSAGSIPGPVSLVLDNLTPNSTLIGANSTTSCTVPAGSSFFNVQQGPLASGQSVTTTLQFSNPSNQGISYSPRVLAGPGTR